MAPKSQEMLRKQKAAKQKKILLLLVPVLVIAGAYNVMKFAKSGDEAAPETAAATSGAADTSAAPADTSATGQASTPPAAGATPPAGAIPAPGSATLIDSDVPPEASEGQLVSFERFIAKNPFQQQVDDQQPAGEEKPGKADEGQPGETPPGTDGSTEAPDEPNTAELTVNGVAESVLVGASFPASDPVFKIVAVKGDTAKIGLVSGSFSTGVDTIDLNVGQTLTLVSQPDGIRYVIKLLAITHSTEAEPDGTTGTPTDTTTTTDTGSTTVPSTTVPSTTVPGTTGADSGTTGLGYTSAGG